MSTTGDAALQMQQQAGIAPARENAIAAQVNRAAVDPEIIAMASAIYTSGEGAISKEQAVRAAYHFHTTGEVMGRDSYVGTKGKVAGQVLEGYRAVGRKINQEYQVKYRPLTVAENEMHGVQPGDKTLACEVYLLDTWAKCRQMGVPYEPIVGVTIIPKSDTQSVPKTKSLYWVLQKQARVDALRQIPGLAVSPEEVFEEAESAGIHVERPDGRVDRDQAALLVKAEAERVAREESAQAGTTIVESKATPAAASEADREFAALPSRGEELRQQAATKAAAEAAAKAADEHPVQTQLPHTARPATAQPPAAQPQAAKQPPAAAATPAPAQPQAAPTRKEKPPRPWDAATTIAALRQAAEYGKRHPKDVVINESYSVTISLLDKVSSDYDHHILIRAVWGVESAKDLTAEQKWSLASWAAPAKVKEEDGTENWVLPKNVQDEFFTVALETPFSEKPTF